MFMVAFNLSFKYSGEHIFIDFLMAPTKNPSLLFLGKKEDHETKEENYFDFLYVPMLYFSLSFLSTFTSGKEIVICCSSSWVYFKDGCRLNKDLLIHY